MDEVNVYTVDVRHELRKRIKFRFGLPPVVILSPVVNEFLHRRELHALCSVRYQFSLRPLSRRDPPTKVDESRLRNADAERTDRVRVNSRVIFWLCGCTLGHDVLLLNL